MNTFIVAALTAPVAIVAPAYADLDSFLSDYKLIEEFCYCASEDYLVVGLITQPMFTLSGITNYVKELESALAEKYGIKEVAVTFDTDLVYAIKKAGKEGENDRVLHMIQTVRKRR